MRTLGIALVAALLSGCAADAPLAHAAASARALGGDVLSALARRDRRQLENLMLSEQEFRRHVWPDLPAARPERNLPFSYVWGDLRQKSAASLSQTLARHGGRQFELVDVRFDSETEYRAYRVHRDPTLIVRAGGKLEELALTGSMLEKDGEWKVFSYVVDD